MFLRVTIDRQPANRRQKKRTAVSHIGAITRRLALFIELIALSGAVLLSASKVNAAFGASIYVAHDQAGYVEVFSPDAVYRLDFNKINGSRVDLSFTGMCLFLLSPQLASRIVIFCQIFWLRFVVSDSISFTASITTGSGRFCAYTAASLLVKESLSLQ